MTFDHFEDDYYEEYDENDDTVFGIRVYDENGYDEDGFDRDGFHKSGLNVLGYSKNDYVVIDGEWFLKYNKEGYDMRGYDKNGFDRWGHTKDDYDEDHRLKVVDARFEPETIETKENETDDTEAV